MKRHIPPDLKSEIIALDEWLLNHSRLAQSARQDLANGKFDRVTEFFTRLHYAESPKKFLKQIITRELKRKKTFYNRLEKVKRRDTGPVKYQHTDGSWKE